MNTQWFPAAGILLAAFQIVSASTLALLSTNEDPNQFPSAPGTNAEQSSSILLDILTETIGGTRSAEGKLKALEKRAGTPSTETSGGQESLSVPGTPSTETSGGQESPSVPGTPSTETSGGQESPSIPGTPSTETSGGQESLSIPGTPSTETSGGQESPSIPGTPSTETSGGQESPSVPGTPSTETSGGQESPSIPGPLRRTRPLERIIPGPIPSALTTSAAHMTVDSQPVSSGADTVEENMASGTLGTMAMLPPRRFPSGGPAQKFSKVPKLCWAAPAAASLKTIVAPKPIRTSLFSIFSRNLCLLWNTSSPIAWRDGHSRPQTAPSVSLGLPVLPWLRNILKATEPLLPESSGRSGLDLTSQAFTVGSGASVNTAALGTGLISSGVSEPLLSPAASLSQPSFPSSPPSSSALLVSSSPSPTSVSFFPPTSSILAPVSSVITGAEDPPKPSVSVTPPSSTDSSTKTSDLTPLMALRPSPPGSRVSTSLIHLSTLSLHFSNSPSVPYGSGFTKSSGDAVSTQSPTLPHPGQDVFLQDLNSFIPGPNHVTHSVTFRINSKSFTTVWNLVALERPQLRGLVCYQLQHIYREAFSSFKNVSALLLRAGTTEVKAFLIFSQPDPSALEILWTLYRKVKASGWLLGYLSLDVSSLSSDGYNMTDLTRETVSISFTLMRPFQPQLLLPGSQPFILLEKQILQLVTHEVSRFYKANPQDQPLLLFSNVNDWVSISMEYKFRSSIPTQLQGLASYLAHHIRDPTLQKSSMVANGEKAELMLYEVRFLILDHPFTKALENKTSPESQELRGQLTKWLTSALQPLQNFGQVVVEQFQQEPLTAKVQAAFFGAAPAQAIIQDCMHQALGFLQETEGLQLEMLIPVLGIPSSRVSRGPSHGFMVNLQLTTSLLVLVALGAAPHFTKKQTQYGS